MLANCYMHTYTQTSLQNLRSDSISSLHEKGPLWSLFIHNELWCRHRFAISTYHNEWVATVRSMHMSTHAHEWATLRTMDSGRLLYMNTENCEVETSTEAPSRRIWTSTSNDGPLNSTSLPCSSWFATFEVYQKRKILSAYMPQVGT